MSHAEVERDKGKQDAQGIAASRATPIRFVRMLGTARRVAGTESQALNVVNRLPDYGYEVHVVWNDVVNPDIPGMLRPEVTWHSLGVTRKRDPRIMWRAYKLFRKLRPDIFMGSMWPAICWGRAAAIAARVPVIISHAESPHPRGKLWMRIMDRCLGGATDLFSANAPSVTEAERRRIGRADLPTEVFYNNVDLKQLALAAREPAHLRETIGAGEDTVVFIAVGTFRWEKGYDCLLRAWSQLRPDREQARLVLVGSGPLFEETKGLAETLGIAESISFLGWREDVPALLREADVYVLSSVSEGSPNVLLEAGAASLPIVTSNARGSNISELVVDQVSALIVKPGSVEDLAQALAAVLDMSEEQRHVMSEAGYRHVAENFSFASPRNTVAQIDRACRRILAEKGRL